MKKFANKPDFIMTFSEELNPQGPCKCWKINKCTFFDRDDIFVIRLNPPITYNDKVDGRLNLEHVAIATRHEGYSLEDIKSWPVYVYVLKLDRMFDLNRDIIEDQEAILIKWAELYPPEDTDII